MGSFIIVVNEPFVQILLQVFQVLVDLFSEGDFVKFIEDRFVEPLTNPVGFCGERAFVLVLSMSLMAKNSW